MIETVGPRRETPRAEVKFGRMEIAGGGIDAQRVYVSGCRDSFGCADRGRVEHQLRKERRTILSESATWPTPEHLDRGSF